MAYFPLFVVGEHLQVLLVGGGGIAAAKLETLAGSGACVTVVALSHNERVKELAHLYGCRLVQQAYAPELLAGCNLVVAATGDAALGARIATDAREAGIWVNVVDNPPLCDFIFPAMIQRGPLQVAISTGGASPVLARLLKQDLEQLLLEGVEELLAFMALHTPTVRKLLPDVQGRRLFWERLIRGPVGRMLAAGQAEAAEAWFQAALAHAGRQAPRCELHVVQIGSFDPDALTVHLVRLIGKADTILYEGGHAMLPLLERYARRDGEKIAVADGADPVALLTGIAPMGGVVVYLALPTMPGGDLRFARLQKYATERECAIS